MYQTINALDTCDVIIVLIQFFFFIPCFTFCCRNPRFTWIPSIDTSTTKTLPKLFGPYAFIGQYIMYIIKLIASDKKSFFIYFFSTQKTAVGPKASKRVNTHTNMTLIIYTKLRV